MTDGADSLTRRPRLAVDMDEVIADAFTKHAAEFTRRTGHPLTPEDVRVRGLHASIPAGHHERFHAIPQEPGFFEDLDVIPGSREALQELSRDFDVYIVSAAMEVPSSFDAKYRWLQSHFPFIPGSRIVFCGDKGIIDADYLVDDRSRHFKDFRGQGILFTAPHNEAQPATMRARDWQDVVRLLRQCEAAKNH